MPTDGLNLKLLQRDPAAFRAAVLPRLDAWQAADFAALDSGWRAVAGQSITSPRLRAWLERPRGHSKSTDIAVSAAWLIFAARKAVKVIVAAADRDQAALLRDAVAAIVNPRPWLASILKVTADSVTNRHTGAEITIITSDVGSSYGHLPDAIIVDELTHWTDRAKELWHSLLSAAAKKSHCMLAVIGNAGFCDSWQWQTRQAVREDPAWFFSRLDGPVASWISSDRLAEQRRLLPPTAFARLWLNQWASGAGDAIDDSDLAAAVKRGLSEATRRRHGWIFCAGLDIGIRHDASAIVVVAKHVGGAISKPVEPKPRLRLVRALSDLGLAEDPPPEQPQTEYIPGDGTLRLAAVRIWKPLPGRKVQLPAVEQELTVLHDRLGLACVACDPWQAEHLIQRCYERGVPSIPVPPVPGNLQTIASETLQAFQERRIELFDQPDLIADLRALRIVERAYGFRLESPRVSTGEHGTRHGDAASALGLGLFAASKLRHVSTENRELVCWP